MAVSQIPVAAQNSSADLCPVSRAAQENAQAKLLSWPQRELPTPQISAALLHQICHARSLVSHTSAGHNADPLQEAARHAAWYCRPVDLAFKQPGSPHSLALEPVLLQSWPRCQVAWAPLQEGWPLRGVRHSPGQPPLPDRSLALCATPRSQPQLWNRRRPQLPCKINKHEYWHKQSHKYEEVPNLSNVAGKI